METNGNFPKRSTGRKKDNVRSIILQLDQPPFDQNKLVMRVIKSYFEDEDNDHIGIRVFKSKNDFQLIFETKRFISVAMNILHFLLKVEIIKTDKFYQNKIEKINFLNYYFGLFGIRYSKNKSVITAMNRLFKHHSLELRDPKDKASHFQLAIGLEKLYDNNGNKKINLPFSKMMR